ncbi:MAG: hypothetical protein JSV65_16110 [Armatimonadota bacterium]|nr:MAG: hypothetical protein JSV65_16110 [Armatimonadota bacterium]
MNLHYFADDQIAEDEREFRTLIAVLHYLREREDTARSLDASRSPRPPVPNDWSAIPREKHLALFAQMKRELIPKQLVYCQDALRRNRYFQGLSSSNQKKWLEGEGLFHRKTGRYLGGSSRHDAGFATTLTKRAEQAGASGPRYDALRRHFSSYVHTAPHVLDQVVGFRAFDWIAIGSQIDAPISVCVGYLALAIKSFLKAFPGCANLLDDPKRELLKRGFAYFRVVNSSKVTEAS